MSLRLSKNPVLNWIKVRHHVWSKLMHCQACGGRNDFFVSQGFLSGFAVSNTCKACLKAESDAVAQCEACGWTGPRGNAYFLKYPDAGPGGMDVELFTCKACAEKYSVQKAKALGQGLKGVKI
jgi:hypothetical protein